MANILVHSSVALFAFIFPDKFSFWPLIFLSNAADMEYFLIGILDFVKGKRRSLNSFFDIEISLGHSIIGNLVLGVFFYILGFSMQDILLGLGSHLLLDLPTHDMLYLFWPKKIKNPFLIQTGILKKIYDKTPYKKIEKEPYQYLGNFNWLVFSMIFSIILVMIIFIKQLLLR